MARSTESLAIVFAGLSGSDRLYESLGDARAREVVTRCLEFMSECIAEGEGIVIKTIGDEIMCTFPSAERAVEAAVAMQEGMDRERPGSDADVAIRIGLHYGVAILEAGDVYGDVVNVAARMAGIAKGGQIITTQETAESLSPALKSITRHLDRLSIKGKSELIDIFEVVWQPANVTRIATKLIRPSSQELCLRLRYRGRELALDQSSGTIVLGRGKKADLIVNDRMASREHARIEFRRDKFVLIDQSTNGTYVVTADGPLYLRGEEATLTGEGQISFGRSLSETEEVVSFSCGS